MKITLENFARRLKQDTLTVYFIARHAHTPSAVKFLALLVAAYALSPIDLIPDFIPVVGYLDDLILLPMGIWLIIRLTPAQVIDESRALAAAASERPTSRAAAVVIVIIWLACFAGIAWWITTPG